MKAVASSLLLGGLLVLGALVPGVAGAAVRVEAPPPFYATGLGHTAESDPGWVITAFYRAVECVPEDIDPVQDMDLGIDPDCPLLVEGFFVIDPGASVPIQAKLTNASGKRVPIWFAGVDEYTEALADGRVTLRELKNMETLVVGWADSFLELRHPVEAPDPTQQHVTEATGYMEDGRCFRIRAVTTKVGDVYKTYDVSVKFGD